MKCNSIMKLIIILIAFSPFDQFSFTIFQPLEAKVLKKRIETIANADVAATYKQNLKTHTEHSRPRSCVCKK